MHHGCELWQTSVTTMQMLKYWFLHPSFNTFYWTLTLNTIEHITDYWKLIVIKCIYQTLITLVLLFSSSVSEVKY